MSMKDYIKIEEEKRPIYNAEANRRLLKHAGKLKDKDPEDYSADEMADMFDHSILFTAEGDRYRPGEGEIPKKYNFGGYMEHMLKVTEHEIGDEVYLIHYEECKIAEGWVVIYDVDELFSKVFKQESIVATVGTNIKGTSFMKMFFELLVEKGIRYDNDLMVWD